MDASRAQETVRRLRWVLAGLVVAWLCCEAAAPFFGVEGPLQLAAINLIIQPHLPIALGGMVVFYFCSRPADGESLRMIGLGTLLALGLKLTDRFEQWESSWLSCVCFGYGVSGLLMLAWRAWRESGAERQRVLAVLLPACLVLGSIPLIFFFLLLTIRLRPYTYDAIAYAADGTLGTQLSFAVGRLFAAAPVLATISLLVYCTLPIAFMVLLVLHVRGQGPPVYDLLPGFLCVAVCGFLTYLIFPITGPLFVFGDSFPNSPPATAAVLAGPLEVPEVPRNCMPSLHTAWALLLWWHSRGLRWELRIAAAFWLGFTILATLGFGAHYAFDVIVAFPSTLACRAACMKSPRRWWTVAWGFLLTATWLILLGHGYRLLSESSWLTAAAASATVIFSVVRERGISDLVGGSNGGAEIFVCHANPADRNVCPTN
jgi:hypothetical protein